jgi:hypothetical protein
VKHSVICIEVHIPFDHFKLSVGTEPATGQIFEEAVYIAEKNH